MRWGCDCCDTLPVAGENNTIGLRCAEYGHRVDYCWASGVLGNMVFCGLFI